MRHAILALSLGHCLTLALAAQEPEAAPDAGLASGPLPGAALTPVPCYATDGPQAGKEFDAAAALADGPGALLFIHELSRNTAPVIRGLDELGAEFGLLGLKVFPILLADDRTAAEAQVQRVNGSLRLHSPVLLGLDGLEGPGNYALNRKATLTLVLADGGAVRQSVGLTDTGPADLPRLRALIESLTGPLPENETAYREAVAARLPTEPEALRSLILDQAIELRRLRAQLAEARQAGGDMQRSAMQPRAEAGAPGRPAASAPDGDGAGNPPARQGRPPEDPQLNALLRSFIRLTNDETRCDSVFADISARAAESAELQGEAVEMFKLMLSFPDRYGTPRAQKLAEDFLREHAPAQE